LILPLTLLQLMIGGLLLGEPQLDGTLDVRAGNPWDYYGDTHCKRPLVAKGQVLIGGNSTLVCDYCGAKDSSGYRECVGSLRSESSRAYDLWAGRASKANCWAQQGNGPAELPDQQTCAGGSKGIVCVVTQRLVLAREMASRVSNYDVVAGFARDTEAHLRDKQPLCIQVEEPVISGLVDGTGDVADKRLAFCDHLRGAGIRACEPSTATGEECLSLLPQLVREETRTLVRLDWRSTTLAKESLFGLPTLLEVNGCFMLYEDARANDWTASLRLPREVPAALRLRSTSGRLLRLGRADTVRLCQYDLFGLELQEWNPETDRGYWELWLLWPDGSIKSVDYVLDATSAELFPELAATYDSGFSHVRLVAVGVPAEILEDYRTRRAGHVGANGDKAPGVGLDWLPAETRAASFLLYVDRVGSYGCLRNWERVAVEKRIEQRKKDDSFVR